MKSEVIRLKQAVVPFEETNTKTSIWQIITTIPPLLVCWYTSYAALAVSFWLMLPLAVITGALVVRTFIIFHDCCHQSFFKSRTANDVLGTITGVLTFVPYRQWKHTHSIHHATSSNLDKRGIGDMWLLTTEEYAASTWWRKLQYRIYRNPFVMFFIGPIAVFLIEYRFNRKGAKHQERINTYVTNVSIVALYLLIGLLVGVKALLLVQAPIFLVSGVLGIWLFYVQHQFEDSYFEHEEEWSYVQAAVEGSSYYKLPKMLQWITGNIGFHHVHHLSPKIPNYYLEKAHQAVPPLQKATTITMSTSLKSLRYRLWSEGGKKFVSFREAKAMRKETAVTPSVENQPFVLRQRPQESS
ncbi:fatty acid desaturase [Gorillibacterium sp. sgz5001074]|uniref:fatty acid desaturase n=1 Tax=Gorillibacterium sp. sgz5001074 TaxID=3446695 RepID=UPI003F672A97